MEIRKTKKTDLCAIDEIINDARAYFRESGIPQWQGEYPSAADFTADIEGGRSYVAEEDGRVIGVLCLDFRPDPNYTEIFEGSFRSDEKYAAVHRIAVAKSEKGKGTAPKMIKEMTEIARERGVVWLRADTHRKNLSMQRMLAKCGFVHCGTIYLEGVHDAEHERFAFDLNTEK